MSKVQVALDWAKDTPCRNITIHGFCKFQDKGCMFKHENAATAAAAGLRPATETQPTSGGTPVLTPPTSSAQLSSAFKKKFSADSPAFLPTASANASTTSLSSKFAKLMPAAGEEEKRFNAESPIFTPSPFNPATSFKAPSTAYTPPTPNPYKPSTPNPYKPSTPNPYAPASGDMYFQAPSAYPLQYHLYAPAPPPHLQIPLAAHETNAAAMFIPNELREGAQRKNAATLQVLAHSNLPESVLLYHSLVPIDFDTSPRAFGLPSALFKVFSATNGDVYSLRRVEAADITSERAITDVQKWRRVTSANVVQFHEAFTTHAFGDNSLCCVYDYHPLAATLRETHVTNPVAAQVVPITEALLWVYAAQVANALCAIHSQNLAARVLDMDSVIVTNRNRVRLGSCGVMDVLEHGNESLASLQAQDMAKFAQLMVDLSSHTVPVLHRTTPELVLEAVSFSTEFTDALRYLRTPTATASEFSRLIAPRVLATMDSFAQAADYMEAQLLSELENARLVRLLAKLGFINERPEYDNDPAWSETGDRYPLKLFRDYVFHQIDERSGRPVVDLAHVIASLNKLDAGVDEKVMLVSSDEQSCIIASYKELHELVDKTFRDLSRNENGR